MAFTQIDVLKKNKKAINNALPVDKVPDGVQYDEESKAWIEQIVPATQIEAWKKKGAIGAGEAYSKLDKLEMIPFINGVTMKDDFGALAIIKKKQSGQEITQDEKDFLNNYMWELLEIQTRGYSFGGKAVNAGLQSIPFMIEFALSAGLVSVGKQAVKQGVKVGAKQLIKSAIAEGTEQTVKKGVKGIVGGVAKATAKSAAITTVMPHQVFKNYADRKINEVMAITDKGQAVYKEASEKPATTFMKSIGDTWIENFSELSGQAILKPVGKLGRKLGSSVASKLPIKFVNNLNNLSKSTFNTTFRNAVEKFGYDGVIEEIGEERIGDLLRASFDLDENKGYNTDEFVKAVFPDAEQFAIEAGLVIIHGGMARSSAYLINKLVDKGVSEKEATAIVGEMSENERETYIAQIDEIETAEERQAFFEGLEKRKQEFISAGVTEQEAEANAKIIENRIMVSAERTGMKRAEILDSMLKGTRFEAKTEEQTGIQYRQLQSIKSEIEAGVRAGGIEKGGLIKTEDKEIIGRFSGVSQYPQYYQDLEVSKTYGYKGKDVVNALDKAINGKKLTEKQIEVIQDLYEQSGYSQYENIFFQEGIQYNQETGDIIQNKNFKNWFADSVIRDKKGNPKIVYHGTDADFNVFDVSKIGAKGSALGYGFYFAEDKSIAQGYEGREGGKVLETYIRIEKPLEKNTKMNKKDIKRFVEELVIGEISKNKDDIDDYKDSFLSDFVDTYSVSKQTALKEVVDVLAEGNDTAIDVISELANVIGDKDLVFNAVRDSLGYDGIIEKNFQESGTDAYVVFFPDNIKSVNNQGTFAIDDPNIYKQEAGKKVQGSFNPESLIITLTEKRDESTLSHEMFHAFVNFDLKHDIELFNELIKVVGINKSIDQLNNSDYEKIQEYGANMYEQYLKEGIAPTEELKTIFELFKQWLKDLRTDIKKYNMQITDEARAYFDKTLTSKGVEVKKPKTSNIKDFKQQLSELYQLIDDPELDKEIEKAFKENKSIEETKEYIKQRYSDKIYEKIAQTNYQEKSFISEAIESSKDIYKSGSEWANKALVPKSDRLKNINKKLAYALRKFEYKNLSIRHKRNEIIKPFLEKYRNISENDARMLDYAFKTSDIAKINDIIKRNDLSSEYKEVRDMLDFIWNEANEAGLNTNYLTNYFPRKIEDPKKFMVYMRNNANWTTIQEELNKIDPDNLMSDSERANFISTMLRGFGGDKAFLSKPSYTKEREIIDLTPEMNSYYKDSSYALIDYVRNMTEAIEARKLFGKSEKDIKDSIGLVVDEMIKNGEISFEDEKQVKDILIARFDKKGTSGIWSLYRDFTYMTLLGSPISAITQIEDVGVTLWKAGVFNTGISLIKSITQNQDIKIEDLGIENITEEFADETRFKKSIKTLFKYTGFTFMDKLGKESYVNGVYKKYKSLAKSENTDFIEKLKDVFGNDYKKVLSDLKGEEITDDIKMLMFNELADIQPLTRSEMPEYYQGNSKVFYILKSFTLRRLSFLRSTVIEEISKNPVKGIFNLTRLMFFLMLAGATTDYIKDFILGRDPEPEELLVNNLFKVFGFGKWLVYQARREGLMSAISRQVVPPFKLADDIYKDIVTKKDIKDWRTWSNVPYGGKYYYWWFGGGSKNNK